MKILLYPNPKLLQPCRPVTVFGAELKVLLDSMWDTMQKAAGIGLAANQVGLEFSMFVMEGPEKEKIFLVNPIIVSRSIVMANEKEGCLSSPGEFILIKDRSSWVEISYKDENGKDHKRVFNGIHAICSQHEIDHLEGKSFLESKTLSKKKRVELAKKWGLKK